MTSARTTPRSGAPRRTRWRDCPELRWHFVGGLQTNKVKLIAGRVAYVHTVDRLELARELSRRLAAKDARTRVFLEVNVAGEASKEGCPPEQTPDLAEAVRALPALELVGLMCILPCRARTRAHTSAGCAGCATSSA